MHHRRDSMDHHGHGHHGHHRREHGDHYEKFGRHHGRVGRHHSPHMDRDRCTRRGKRHGFGKLDDVSYHILNETEVRNIIGENPNSKDQIRQIVRGFFKREHEMRTDSSNETSDETTARDGTTRREGEFDWRHFVGRRGRRGHHWDGWTYGPCNVEQGRNNEEKEPNKPEEGTSTNRHYGWHYRPNSSQFCAICTDKGRSSQEETSDNQEEMDYCCKWRRRMHAPEMRHSRRWKRHGCHIIFVDSPSFTRIATEEANKEVSQPSDPMESTTEGNQQPDQEAETPEVQEVAENLRKSSLG